MVLQLQGSKDWTICVPQPDAFMAGSNGANYTEADLCQLQEMRLKRQEGCTSYSDADLARMTCRTLTLAAGDTLYLPKGVIHHARTRAGGSAHLTLSLERDGANWVDVIAAAALSMQDEPVEATAAATARLEAHARHRAIVASMERLVNTPQGLPLLQAFPLWAVYHGDTGGSQASQAAAKAAPLMSCPTSCRNTLWQMYASRIALIRTEIEHWQMNGGARRNSAAWAQSRAAAARGNGGRNRGRSGPSAPHAVPWVAPLPAAHVVGPMISRAALVTVMRRLEGGERLPVYNRMMPRLPTPVASTSPRSESRSVAAGSSSLGVGAQPAASALLSMYDMRQRHLANLASDMDIVVERSRRESIGGRTCNAGCDDSCVRRRQKDSSLIQL